VTPVLVVLAVIAALGAALAVTARVPRLAVLGLVVALAAAPFVADPSPSVIAIAARVVAAVLAGYACWAALRGARSTTEGSPLGWPGVMAIVVVVLAAGWLAAGQLGAALAAGGTEGPGTGSAGVALASGSPVARASFAAGLALLVLAAAPVAFARDALRLGIGLLLLLAGTGLVGASLERPGESASLVLAGLTAGIGLAIAELIRRALESGALTIHEPPRREPAVRAHPLDDAHPADHPRDRAR
jgi:hypothetical protein